VEQQGNSHSKNSTWIKQDLKFCLSLWSTQYEKLSPSERNVFSILENK
jgi:hypothetical protein